MNNEAPFDGQVALVTGAARRLGAHTTRQLHKQGCNVAIHYHRSAEEAQALAAELNKNRDQSATLVQTELGNREQADYAINEVIQAFGQLNILVNNASSFFPTPLGDITDEQVHDLLSSNLSAPLFLMQAASPYLREQHGTIINMIDIHAIQPYTNYSVYCAAKSGLDMLTRSMAIELAPEVRVNGVAPGVILWPDNPVQKPNEQQADVIRRVPLQRIGEPQDIANAIIFLASPAAAYITGQVLSVDGGKSLQ